MNDKQLAIDLLKRLREGNREAASEVVARLSPIVHRIVFRLTGWHSETNDLVQEVFLAIQKSSTSFQGKSTLETWVIGIAIRCCRKWQRSQMHAPHFTSEELDTYQAIASVPQLDQADELQIAMKRLSLEDRELIVLRYLEDMPLDDMAELLGVRKNTLEVRLHRIRQRLAELLSIENEIG